MRWLLIPLMAAVLPAPLAFAQLATVEELRALVAQGQYAPALQQVTAALQVKGPAAASMDRHALYLLKAECHLQLKAAAPAADAFASAAKEAPDATARLLAGANEHLVRQSKGLAYTPKAPPNSPRPPAIDLLPPDGRKKAFAALLADETAALAPKLKAAREATALPPIAAMQKPLALLEGLELAATGKAGGADNAAALRKALADRAIKVTADHLRQTSKRLGEIDRDANTWVEFYQDVQDPLARFPRMIKERAYKKRGLTEAHTKALAEINATCDRLPPALAELSEALAVDAKAFDPQAEEAARIRRESDRVLDTDYQRVVKEVPKK